MAFPDQDDSTESEASTAGSGSDTTGSFKPADSDLFSLRGAKRSTSAEYFSFFNEFQRKKSSLPQQPFFQKSSERKILYSRYRLLPNFMSLEEKLELLMGRAFQTGEKEVIFNAILELLMKDTSGKLKNYYSKNYGLSPIELALRLNNGGCLDKIIGKLKNEGCAYSPDHEPQILEILRRNSELTHESEYKTPRPFRM